MSYKVANVSGMQAFHPCDPWLYDSESLLRNLDQCGERVMQIPISNPDATQDGIKIALNA